MPFSHYRNTGLIPQENPIGYQTQADSIESKIFGTNNQSTTSTQKHVNLQFFPNEQSKPARSSGKHALQFQDPSGGLRTQENQRNNSKTRKVKIVNTGLEENGGGLLDEAGRAKTIKSRKRSMFE